MNRRMVRGARSIPLRRAVVIAAAAVCVTGVTRPMAAQQQRPPAARAAAQADPGAIGVFPLRGNVYVLVGAGGNVTVQVGAEGVLAIDTGTAASSAGMLAAIAKLSDLPIRWVVNTSVHAEHTGGNEAFFRTGVSTAQNQFGSGRAFPGSLPTGATIIAHENVLKRMSAPTVQPPIPSAAWPVATYFGDKRELYFNGEAIEVIHQSNAVTDGDSIVVFRHADLVATGDLFVTTGYPVLDLKTGGTINGLIDALNNIIDITIPGDKQEGGTYVIPGRGRICDEADVVTYRNMVTIIRDRIQDLTKKGMTLEQVKAARPTADYDSRWSTPAWTGDMFVEAAYRTLTPSRPVSR